MLDTLYSPARVEPRWVGFWRSSGAFRAEAGSSASSGAEPYAIVIPPPNVTGALHIGHALNNALQDVLIRYHRLLGRGTCWVPGTDHGGIATHSVMERQLKAEKLTRHQLGRDKFLERMRSWTLECKSTILGQLERLGCALDWEREAYTMDDARAKAVYRAFELLWSKGLIKRGERIVNWCVRCGTALSDVEVEYEDRKGRLWHMRYPAQDAGEGLVVATTRPETMLGDTAVAVNPRDPRYAKWVGKTLRLPLMDRPIPVVADDSVDFAFGTGAVKVTPAHDANDFEIAQRHGLPAIKVIGPDGKMSAAAGRYAGLSREAGREKVLADLGDLLVKTEEHPHSVGACYRCGQAIEPLLSWQWFVRMKPLAEPALQALADRRFRIYPESWAKPYRDWLAGIKDWGVSRQIWWGHRIPVWYCLNCNRDLVAAAPKPGQGGGEWSVHQIGGAKGVASASKPVECARCGVGDFIQDPDVLDTWFSSALWPLSVLGWPEETEALKAYYPTQVLVTGYEILYLWVARMQMMGLELRGRVPFHHALIHGIVRDKTGKKMSKSLGNVVDPLAMMERYGTDALRFSLITQAHPGKDILFSEESLTGARNFANKIWNSTRFVLMHLPETPPPSGYSLSGTDARLLELADRWILGEYRRALSRVHEHVRAYELAQAADVLYAFLWDSFCDWYVELSKMRLSAGGEEEKETVRAILATVLVGTLKMLHPFMPFITEELYQSLKAYVGEKASCVALSGPPRQDPDGRDPAVGERMGRVMEVVTALRTLRAELNVPPGLKLEAFYFTQEAADRALPRGSVSEVRREAADPKLLDEHGPYITHLAKLSRLTRLRKPDRPSHCATAIASGFSFYVPLEGVIDLDKERRRLAKAMLALEAELRVMEARLADPNFTSRAPKSEVQKINAGRERALSKHSRLKETLSGLH